MTTEPSVIKEPKLYDLFNQECTSDIEMYASIFRQAEILLELGIGTGRLAIPLAKQGFHIVGVDDSPEMITRLRTKLLHITDDTAGRIKIVHQDFCHLSLDSRFDYAYYPFCTFNYLLTTERQIEALIALRKHLNHNAVVIFDLMTFHTFQNMLSGTGVVQYQISHDDELNLDVKVSTQGSYDQATQIFTQERFFKYYNENDYLFEKRVRMINRIVHPSEFKLLLEKCGYQVNEVYGGYDCIPFSTDSQCLIVVASPVL